MKSYLLVKSNCLEEDRTMFGDYEINITDEGRNYLGTPISTREYIEDYCRSKAAEWMDEIEVLS